MAEAALKRDNGANNARHDFPLLPCVLIKVSSCSLYYDLSNRCVMQQLKQQSPLDKGDLNHADFSQPSQTSVYKH